MNNKKPTNKKQDAKIYRVTNNCTVTLKSKKGNDYKKIVISTVNGFDKYACLIGKPKGKKVHIDGGCWIIGYIDNGKRKRRRKAKYSAMSHPLNNTIHFVR